ERTTRTRWRGGSVEGGGGPSRFRDAPSALHAPPSLSLRRCVRSPLAGNLDSPGDDLLLDLLESRPHRVGDEGAVVLVVDVADAVLLEAEGVDAALEGAVLHALDDI